MAIARKVPTCSYCGKPTAKGIYKDESNIPKFMQTIGDTFIRWDYKQCNCKEAVKDRKEHKKIMDKWHKENPLNLENIINKKYKN
jgi:hypothetical protein